MRALVKTKPAPGIELLEVDVPEPRDGEILIRVEAGGVCGSDIARYTWSRDYEAGAAKDMTQDLPRILGHEFAGVVESTRTTSTPLEPGQRVAIRNTLGCGHCRSCQEGLVNVCARRRTIGVHRDGGYAEYCAIPAENCTVIDDGLSMHLAAALQPFAVGTNAVELSGLGAGDRVLIWGLGPIGLAVAFAARLRGGDVVLGIDINEVRATEAERHGIPTLVVDPEDKHPPLLDTLAVRSIDIVFEAAGASTAIEASLPVLEKGRPIVLIGNLKDRVDADLMPLIMDQQALLGSRSYSLRAWQVALQTVGSSDYSSTLGDEIPLDDALERFELAAEGKSRPFTIMPHLTR